MVSRHLGKILFYSNHVWKYSMGVGCLLVRLMRVGLKSRLKHWANIWLFSWIISSKPSILHLLQGSVLLAIQWEALLSAVLFLISKICSPISIVICHSAVLIWVTCTNPPNWFKLACGCSMPYKMYKVWSSSVWKTIKTQENVCFIVYLRTTVCVVLRNWRWLVRVRMSMCPTSQPG